MQHNIETIIEQLEAKRTGNGWAARCPAHDDRTASLSIGSGDDGRTLLHCHAGCAVDDICRAAGMTVADLMPTTRNDKTSANQRNNGFCQLSTEKTKPKTYSTAAAAIESLDRIMEKDQAWRVAQFPYHDADGRHVGSVVRYDLPTPEGEKQRKEFRPVSLSPAGWIIGGMPEPRPLYHLPDLAGADRVYICEGEKAADAARSIGLVATTSPHGAKSAGKADWRPLAGKECIILPDANEAGEGYAADVAGILLALDPPATVKIVRLPDLPPGGDIHDWIEQRDAHLSEELAATINEFADQAEAVTPEENGPGGGMPSTEIPSNQRNNEYRRRRQEEQPAKTVERIKYRSYPVGSLPEPLSSFVEAGAKAIGCDASYLALPLLTALASAIGNSRRLRVKKTWSVPSILWAAIVGESGTSKSPAISLALRPFHRRQAKAIKRHREAMQGYEDALKRYEKEHSEWKKSKEEGNPPEKPAAPTMERIIVSDTTIEALSQLLNQNPRGLFLQRDELAGWLNSFDRYTSGKSADSAHWLSIFDGNNLYVDRRTGTPPMIYVPKATVSITGGIQPGILHRALGSEHRESGLAARLLLAYPPRKAKQWREADVHPALISEVESVVEELYELKPGKNDDGEPEPIELTLSPDAKAKWIEWYNEHNREQAELTGDLAAAWSKLEGYTPRIALVLQLVRDSEADEVDLSSMTSAISIVQWHKGETRRVYSMLTETAAERELRELAEWIGVKGGSITARELQQGRRGIDSADEADKALQQLVAAGYGEWEQSPPGKRGQPTRRFCLSTPSTVYGNR